MRRKERAEFAEQNIPRELLPAWRRIAPKMKGKDRAEKFLQWAHDNPDEVLDLVAGDAERRARAELRALQDCHRAVERGRKELADAGWHGASFSDDTIAALRDCERRVDPSFDPSHIEQELRLAEYGAPF